MSIGDGSCWSRKHGPIPSEMSGIETLSRVAEMAEGYGQLPDRHDATVAMLAKLIEHVMRTSPWQQAEQAYQISRMMREM